ncbi:hypothetical protein Patl1_14690 [Pistacia atlantica]|uniref:Uncharacterized protein n=1 Tax=Pistacia atlantica TaxID=434234 RepID=A0ACC1AVX3_9ROSI|nr:hypothetical protein Patl1_14690 [Pistacia atlantica]
MQGFEKLSKLSNLEELNLGGNNFNNSILSSLAGVSSLKYLDLSGNRFKGVVNIEELDMRLNEIDHFVSPKGLQSLKNLKELDMGRNRIDRFVNSKGLSNLKVISLSHNNLSNSILSSLGGLSSLKSLYLEDIGLNGTVDVEGLCSLKNLEELYMDWNKIDKFVNSKDYIGLKKLNALSLHSGIETTDATIFLQSTFRLFPSLKILDLSHNSFNQTMIARGSIYFRNLENLDMEETILNNSSSQIFKPIISLKKLSLSNCGLNGTLYDQGRLEISTNFFHGQIPIEIGAKLPKMLYFNISRNSFNGSIPSSFGNVSFLQSLDLSNNNLAGGIPEHLAIGCFSLEKLVLSNNNLQGNNHLEGELPTRLCNLTKLRLLDLSQNSLYGKTPERINQFATFKEGSYLGNTFLCGLPLNKSCNLVESPSLTPGASTENKEDDNDFVDMDIFYITFVVTYIVVLLVIVLVEKLMISCYYFVIDHLP